VDAPSSRSGAEVGGAAHAALVIGAILRGPGEPLVPPAEHDMPTAVARLAALHHQVMVFLNTAEAAQRLASSLNEVGVRCGQFHKLAGSEQRQRDLEAFREGSERILVCTDSAGRGLDLPNVRHVIQAEFALNVVQHQHRVGRASRAGRPGRATNLYNEAAEPLVQSIRGVPETQELDFASEEREQPQRVTEDAGAASGEGNIEKSFSRRRGFRKNMRRRNERRGSGPGDGISDSSPPL
jgi:superfamily II DNA/RNA helicase